MFSILETPEPRIFSIGSHVHSIAKRKAKVKWIGLSLILGLIPLNARGQGVSVQGQAVVNTTTSVSGIPGNSVLQAVSNPTITVCSSAGGGIPCTPLVTIYSNVALTVTTSNPLPICAPAAPVLGCVDANGNFQFFIAPNATGYVYSQTGLGIVGQLFTISPQTGSLTGTTTFGAGIRYTATANCSASGIAADIAAVGAGGTVHAEGCTSGFVALSTITITTPVVLYLPCVNATSAIYVNSAPFMFIQSNGVKVYGCDSGAQGTTTDGSAFGVGTPGTYVIACTGNGTPVAGCTGALPNSSAGDIIEVQSQSRSTQPLARISSVQIQNIYIEMNGVGRRGVYLSSCWHCKVDHVGVDKGNGDGDFYIEADPAADGTLDAASYNVQLNDLSAGELSTNTTTHPFFFDASNGEIAYILATNLRAGGAANATGAGSDSYYVLTGTAAGSVNNSFDQNVFITTEGFNPVANAYGIKMQCKGNFFAATGGRCFNNTFTNAQVERLFGQAASGTAIGCVNAAGTADGTGCGYMTFIDATPFNYTTLLDEANLGGHLSSINRNISDSGESPTYDFLGKLITNNAGAVDVPYFKIAPSSLSANGAGQNFHAFMADMSIATSSGGSTPNLSTAFYCKPGTIGGVTNICLYDAGSSNAPLTVQGNSLAANGNFRFQENATQPNGPLAGFDYCGGSSVSHALQCSYNNDAFGTVPKSNNAAPFTVSLRATQQIADQGSVCTNGELALSAGWQSTGSATVTAVAGNGQTCSWTITTGTTTAANPTVTDTLTNALPSATTVCEMNIHGGTHTAAAGEGFQQTALSATAPVFTFNGTPTAGGTTYFITRRCGP